MIGLFLADLTLTGIAAWLVTRTSHHSSHPLEAFLAWILSLISIVAGTGVVLGLIGGFGPLGFFVFHALFLVVLAGARRKSLREDFAAALETCRDTVHHFRLPGLDRVLGIGVLLILLGLSLIAALAEPVIIDAVTYHLPRMAHWLQDGQIRFLESADARMNYVAAIPEIVMAWFVGATQEGFHLSILPQALGGVLAVGSTIGLAHETGLSRRASLLAGALLFGMANVVIQFTAAQTDLFTTGVLSSSIYLSLVHLKRGLSSPLGAVGVALAIGSKGTLFYLAPSLAIWAVWADRRYSATWRQRAAILLFVTGGITLYALPGLARNQRWYGSMLGPANWVKQHHTGFDSFHGQLSKAYWNLLSSLSQNMEAQAQPDGLREISQSLAKKLLPLLPTDDPYRYTEASRQKSLTSAFAFDRPDPDIVGFGLIPALLFFGGMLLAVLRSDRLSARPILVWGGGVILFFCFYSVMQQWHAYAFRYFVLVAPWIAIVGAWTIEQLPSVFRTPIWFIAIIAAVDVGARCTFSSNQSGWRMITRPESALGYAVSHAWKEWSLRLQPSDTPLTIALPWGQILTGFYRQVPAREIRFKSDSNNSLITAEDFIRGEPGWVIVPAARFLGHEGSVAGNVWTVNGDLTNQYSVAAYRSLNPGEKPKAIIYRNRTRAVPNATRHEILAKVPAYEKLRVTLKNHTAAHRLYTWRNSDTRGDGVLAGELAETIQVTPDNSGIVNLIIEVESSGNGKKDAVSAEILN